MMRTEPIFPAAPAEPSPLWGISRPAMTDRTAIIDRMVEDIAVSRQFDRPNSTPGRWWLLGRGWAHRCWPMVPPPRTPMPPPVMPPRRAVTHERAGHRRHRTPSRRARRAPGHVRAAMHTVPSPAEIVAVLVMLGVSLPVLALQLYDLWRRP